MKIFGVTAVVFPLVGSINIDSPQKTYETIEFTTTKATERLHPRDVVTFEDGTLGYVTGISPFNVQVMAVDPVFFTEKHLTMDFGVVASAFSEGENK